jgi:hypothetical protein
LLITKFPFNFQDETLISSKLNHRSWVKLACFLTLISCLSCGSSTVEKPDHIPTLTACQITVTYKGTPVEEASVLVAPKDGKYSAAGITNAQGIATMKTDGLYDGVVSGSFRVTVTKKVQIDPPADPTEVTEPDSETYGLKGVVVHLESLVPEQYSSFKESGLTLDATEGTPQEVTFDLVD